MFASNTAEVLNFNKEKNVTDIFTKILYIHKKLKEIAKYESSYKSRFNIAKLNSEQLENIKTLEGKLNCCLVAYEAQYKMQENKLLILNKIHSLLDEYICICKACEENKLTGDFNKLFEQ